MKIKHIYPVSNLISIHSIYTLFEATYTDDYSFPGETHNFWECVYCFNGRITSTSESKIYTLTKGQLLFHKPFEFHKLAVDHDTGASFLIFTFSTEAEDFMRFFEGKAFSLTSTQVSHMNAMLKFLRDSYNRYFTDLDIARKKYVRYANVFHKSNTFSQMVAMYIQMLLLMLSKDGASVLSYTTSNSEIFSKAINYMKINVSNNISTTEIAKHCAVSVSQLNNIFREHSGIGIHRHFLQFKISLAMQLLKEGKNSTQIAYELGFSSQAYFSYVFKRETNMTPSQYKELKL